MPRWLPTLWLGFVILRYGLTSFKTVDAPHTPGLDVQWAVEWIAIVLAIMFSAALLKHSVVHRIWFGLLGAAALTILILSHTVLPGVLAQAPVASVLFWNIPERFPRDRALGRETPESFLARGTPEYRSARFLNSVSQPGEKILGIEMEQVRFYLDAPLYTQRFINLTHFTTPAAARSELAREGFTCIVVSTKALQKPPAWFGYLQPEFLESFAERLYSDDAAAVFRVRNR